MRFAGAQIPVTRDLDRNVETIKTSIDWATKNKCDYLITPEGSLSGYMPDFDTYSGASYYLEDDIRNPDFNPKKVEPKEKRKFDDVENALMTIENYAGKNGVGLVLGTLYIENESQGKIKRNQQRYYSPDGMLLGTVNKRFLIRWDNVIAGHYSPLISMPNRKKTEVVKAVGMLCNDLWGGWWTGEENIGREAKRLGADILIHSSNGARGLDPIEDKIHDDFHTGCLAMITYSADMPIISVDNSIHMDGNEYHGETSSPSGAWYKEKLIDVPRTGTQHFHFDFTPKPQQTQFIDPAISFGS
ncbi:uncharacterized protein METZ01_LOCUS138649 [marine metagenome]|uniref:CN hydrolase domain-containing protein n=1 Tax=marine metagenome TaxID=408172 RepID=A0A381Z912_9ZZZZ